MPGLIASDRTAKRRRRSTGSMTMAEQQSRFWSIFLEVFEALPRQGPGSRETTARAFALCTDLPATPIVLDLGCGGGAQTLHVASLTDGSIVAIDIHAPSIEKLQERVTGLGLTDRIEARVGDMTALDLPAESFDLIWSEGALYSIGLEPALQICHDLLRPGGYLAFTDAVYLKDNPPREVTAMFEDDYSTMGEVDNAIALLEASGFDLVGHFTLPDEAWWEDFYTPMVREVDRLRTKYAGDAEALAALDEVAGEADLRRRFGDFYAYEFFVARRPTT